MRATPASRSAAISTVVAGGESVQLSRKLSCPAAFAAVLRPRLPFFQTLRHPGFPSATFLRMPYDSFPKDSVFNVTQASSSDQALHGEVEAQAPDRRLSAPAALRNREFIAEVIKDELPTQGAVLEIASGTGEHVSFFAKRFSQVSWQPSDVDPMALASIADWVKHSPLPNLLPPLTLNVEEEKWPMSKADALLNINMIHISPYSACEGLMKGASRLLPEGGPLILYGPFKRNGAHTAPSNEQFDASLRMRNSSWGVRDVAEVAATAEPFGLQLVKEVPMPANNLIVVFRKKASK